MELIVLQQFRDVDEEELKACERLVHDQHLQQQGWAAVVANLEDITRYTVVSPVSLTLSDCGCGEQKDVFWLFA